MNQQLSVLPYHRVVADLLERENPRSFEALLPGSHQADDGLDQALLRTTYRLEPASHPGPHAALRRAADALGVGVPVELYAEEGAGPPNASYVHTPGRAVVVVSGPLLDLLDDDETCGVLGHELAHHVLWTVDGGRHLAASRLLDVAEHDARTPSAYLETARRHRLSTELFCDRGALVSTDRLASAVSGLVKAATGLSRVDPEAYLRQAAEIDVATGSTGSTHPETVLRAWALQQWAGGPDDPDVEADVARAVGPDVDLALLDLPGQDRLLALTRALVWDATLLEPLRSPEVVGVAVTYGVTPAERASPVGEVSAGDLGALPPDTRRYLAAVLADLATADEESSRAALTAALAVARRKGLERDLTTLLVAELDLTARDTARLRADADTLLATT